MTNKITQAMILSAGKGTRMRPLTLTTPKPLIDVGGQPLIVWHILALKSAGITDITVNSSWLADKLMDALGDGSQFGVRLHWSLEEGEPLETAGGIAKALIDGKLKQQPFILVNGDVWTTFDFAELANVQLTADKLAHLLLIDNPEHNPAGDFVLAEGLASRKPAGEQVNEQADKETDKKAGAEDSEADNEPKDEPKPAYTFSGMSVINPELLASVGYNETSSLAPLLMLAMDAGKVSAEKITSKWVDVGTPERLQQTNEYIAQELLAGVHKGQLARE